MSWSRETPRAPTHERSAVVHGVLDGRRAAYTCATLLSLPHLSNSQTHSVRLCMSGSRCSPQHATTAVVAFGYVHLRVTPVATSCRFCSTDFVPFIVTAVLPTVISSQWRGIDSHRLTRDEQTWLSTTYVQIYAFLQVRTPPPLPSV